MPHVDFVNAQVAFLRTLATMAAGRGASVLVIADVPKLTHQGRTCLYPNTFASCRTPRSSAVVYTQALHVATDAAYAALASEVSNVKYIPSAWVYDRLCTSTECGPELPGTTAVGWLDDWHLSTAGSLYLAPFLHCWLTDNGVI